MNNDMNTVEGVLNQIIQMVNRFEGKKLPYEAVGAIEGWCKRAIRLASEKTSPRAD